jgi:hypothetical protein
MVQTYTSQSENDDGSRVPVKRVIGILIVLGLIALVAWGAYEAWRRSSAKSEGGTTTTTNSTAAGGDSTTLSTAAGGGDTTTTESTAGGDDTTTGSTTGGTTKGTTAGTSVPSSGLSTGAIVGIVIGLLFLSSAVISLMIKTYKRRTGVEGLIGKLEALKKRLRNLKEGAEIDLEFAKNALPKLSGFDRKRLFYEVQTLKDYATNEKIREQLKDVELVMGRDRDMRKYDKDGLSRLEDSVKDQDWAELKSRIRGNMYTQSLLIERLIDILDAPLDAPLYKKYSDDDRKAFFDYLKDFKKVNEPIYEEALQYLDKEHKDKLEEILNPQPSAGDAE